jgi:cytoskeletal protein RodZ
LTSKYSNLLELVRMSEEEQKNTEVSPPLQSSQNLGNFSHPSQSRKTLILGLTLVVAMIILVGAAFYSLRSGTSSTPAPSPSPAVSSTVSADQKLDQDMSQVNSDLVGIDSEINGVDIGLNDKQTDLSY